jgi:histidinol-phosphate aminotransferase
MQPGDTIVYNFPSYSMYSVYSSVRGLNIIKISLKEDGEWWKEDLESLYNNISKARLVIIDDPNNPTGSPMLKAKEDIISNIAEKVNGLLVVDEAYYEFSGYTVKDFINKYKNVAIVRTLSKAFSLASFRIGYLIADKELIKVLNKATTPFDIPLPSLIAGISALEKPDYAFNIASEIKKNRDFLYESMKKLGLKVYRSLTNFLYFKYNGDLIHPLLSKGLAIRRPNNEYYRVTVGTLDQCVNFIEKLGEIIENSNTK